MNEATKEKIQNIIFIFMLATWGWPFLVISDYYNNELFALIFTLLIFILLFFYEKHWWVFIFPALFFWFFGFYLSLKIEKKEMTILYSICGILNLIIILCYSFKEKKNQK